jgi:hypothetical protein
LDYFFTEPLFNIDLTLREQANLNVTQEQRLGNPY